MRRAQVFISHSCELSLLCAPGASPTQRKHIALDFVKKIAHSFLLNKYNRQLSLDYYMHFSVTRRSFQVARLCDVSSDSWRLRSDRRCESKTVILLLFAAQRKMTWSLASASSVEYRSFVNKRDFQNRCVILKRSIRRRPFTHNRRTNANRMHSIKNVFGSVKLALLVRLWFFFPFSLFLAHCTDIWNQRNGVNKNKLFQ